MPRGTAHTPVTGASESLHLTLAMDIKSNWADYLRVVWRVFAPPACRGCCLTHTHTLGAGRCLQLMDASLSETIDEPIKELTDLLHSDNWFSAGRKPPTVSRKALLQVTVCVSVRLWACLLTFCTLPPTGDHLRCHQTAVATQDGLPFVAA